LIAGFVVCSAIAQNKPESTKGKSSNSSSKIFMKTKGLFESKPLSSHKLKITSNPAPYEAILCFKKSFFKKSKGFVKLAFDK